MACQSHPPKQRSGPVRSIVSSVEAEYRRYKALGEGTIAQLDEAELSAPGPAGGNSIAIIVWHIAGNLASRFTDFRTSGQSVRQWTPPSETPAQR